ncbi:protein-tyrosine phosphatase family protein [Providencia alcalifaciens]|uniref:protein-tyrosine phosphatase family protein n=1 Tax=Providencia alcalifaciens TaxID=126385 RepID=UPI001E48B59C|nr:protein-tyrosine phosphatase family protein [Providencia alcalifaciens]
MFPITSTRPAMIQAVATPSTSVAVNHPVLTELNAVKNTPQTSSVVVNPKVSLNKRPKLKLNISLVPKQSEFDKLKEKTQLSINEKNIEYDTQDRGQRYPNIGSAKQTQISILNKAYQRILLSANRLQIKGDNLAICCQYPKNETQAIENHLTMLMENKAPLLVVLSSKSELNISFGAEQRLPAYFMGSKQYGDIEVTSLRLRVNYRVDKNVDQKDKMPLMFSQYKLEIKGRGRAHNLPVIHIINWDDGKTITTSELKKLSRMVDILTHGSLIKLKKYQGVDIEGRNKPLPVIHCKAGIGRTGVLAAAMQLTKKDNRLTVDDIVVGLRTSGNMDMVQTEAQYNTLVDLQKYLK